MMPVTQTHHSPSINQRNHSSDTALNIDSHTETIPMNTHHSPSTNHPNHSSDLPPGYKQTEIGVIPEDWEIKQIGELQPFVTSGSRGWAEFYSDRGDLFIRITNLSRSSIYLDLSSSRFVDLFGNTSEAIRTQVQNGDILISVTADIGIIGYVSAKVPKPAYINQHIALIRLDSLKVNSRYISYFLASETPQKLFRALTDSGAKAGMNLTTVQSIRVALPPTLAEQTAIAEALGDADAHIDAQCQLIAKKRLVKEGAMQALLTGKRRLPGFAGEWEERQIQDICEVDPESIGSDTKPDYEFRYISLEDVEYGRLAGWSELHFVDAPSRARRKVKMGDVLIGTVRPNLRSHCLIDIDADDIICSTGFAVLRCQRQLAEPYFVFAHFFASFIGGQIEVLVTGSNYPALNSSDVKQLRIPMPPTIEEQTAIAAVLSDMDGEIGALEEKLVKARQVKEGMMQELLTGRIRLV